MTDPISRDSEFPPWIIVPWTIWSVIIAACVIYFDHDPRAAGLWLASGVTVGFLWWPVTKRLFPLMSDTCHRLTMSSTEYRQFFLRANEESEEQKRLMDRFLWGALLAIPPFFALMHGPLWGGLIGILLHFDRGVSASRRALIGITITSIAVAMICAIGCAIMTKTDPSMTLRQRIARRAFTAISPIVIVPVFAWNCLRRATWGIPNY